MGEIKMERERQGSGSQITDGQTEMEGKELQAGGHGQGWASQVKVVPWKIDVNLHMYISLEIGYIAFTFQEEQ